MPKAIFIPAHDVPVPEQQLFFQMAAISIQTGDVGITFNQGQAHFKLTPEQLEQVTAVLFPIILAQNAFKGSEIKNIPEEVTADQDDSGPSKEGENDSQENKS